MGCDSLFTRMGAHCISELPLPNILKPKQDLFCSRKIPGRVDGGARKVGTFPLVETKSQGRIFEGFFLQK